VTEKNGLRITQDSGWQLLAEHSLSSEPGSEGELTAGLLQTLQELGLRPAQAERIGKTVVETVQKALQRQNQERYGLPILLRIWVSAVYAQGGSQLGSKAAHDGRRQGNGWGFYSIERQRLRPQSSQEGPDQDPDRMIELFLYQERMHSKR
jgi:hypothetical protein